MGQNIILSVDDLIEDAENEIETISVKQALSLYGDADVAFIDLRDTRELDREGRIPGAIHIPRGSLEFSIDPRSATHHRIFASDKRFVFVCAGGLRSALAAQSARRMGLDAVCHLAGGYAAWKRTGGPVELPGHAPGEDWTPILQSGLITTPATPFVARQELVSAQAATASVA